MASTPIEIPKLPQGLTLTCDVYPQGSDTADQTGITLTEATNRKGTYSGTVTAASTGVITVKVKSGSTVIAEVTSTILDTTATFILDELNLSDLVRISGDATAATVLKNLMLGTPSSTVNDGAATSTSFVTALTETTNDHYAGAFILFTDGALVGQSQKITAYNGTSKTITCDAFTEAPGNGDAFLILGKDPN